jgi:hypothetical protein
LRGEELPAAEKLGFARRFAQFQLQFGQITLVARAAAGMLTTVTAAKSASRQIQMFLAASR